MAWLGPILVGLLVASGVIQLVWAYALSAIARKTEQSGLMELLAWIPVLQLAPMLAAGGGSTLRFAIGAVGLVLGNAILVAVATMVGGSFGRGLAFLGLGLSALLCVCYFGQIAWNTAVARHRPGWVGLLSFVPLANLLVYPYLAFYDGWPRPNPVGLLVALVLVVGSTAPAIQTARSMNENPEVATALAGLASLNGADNEFAFEAPTGSETSSLESDPALVATVAFDPNSSPPIRPLPVQVVDGCPPGTDLRSRTDQGHEEEWCQQRPEQGGLRHGWYARYTMDGRPESMGEYRNGLRVGVWTRFYENGAVRAQAEFHEGLQHGWLLTFDEAGQRTRAVRFEQGVLRD